MRGYPTGFLSLDRHLQPQGLFGLVEVFGQEDSGKSTLSAQIAAATGGNVGVVLCDSRNDPGYLSKIIPGAIAAVPMHGEAALEVAFSLIPSCTCVILDSTVGIVPVAEERTQVGSRELNAQSRLLFHGFTVLRRAAIRHNCLVIAVSELRTNIARRRMQSSCERVTKELSDFRIVTTTKSMSTDLGVMDKKLVEVLVRSKSCEIGSSTLTLVPDHGFSRGLDALDVLLRDGTLKRSGSAYVLDGVTLGLGKRKAAEALERLLATETD